jgi:phosphatidylglycerol lysyltransferase
MVPLSGMQQHLMAPRWHRVGRLPFVHGEQLVQLEKDEGMVTRWPTST